jgi:hypothetical protein
MRTLVGSAALFVLLLGNCDAQPPKTTLATQIHIKPDGGPLSVTIDGQEKRISPAALKAWMLGGGRSVAYSTAHGGGFENEGESLHILDSASGKDVSILTESFEIIRVEEAKGGSGKTALLVSMEDGGLGASHIAVVDPLRGEVLRADGARFATGTARVITVSWYKDDDWEKLDAKAVVTPYRT